MPVDIFGKTYTMNGAHVVSGGMTLSQANNTFLRRDGRDYMTGNLALNVGTDMERTIGCSDLSGTKQFSIILGNISNQLQYELHAPVRLRTSDGFVVSRGGHDIIRFGRPQNDLRVIVYQDILMNKRRITGLSDPSSAQEAATKNYVDSARYLTAYPTMTANTTSVDGLTYTASCSVVSDSYHSWKAFQNIVDDGWIAPNNANKWIQIQYPALISMTGFYIVVRKSIVGISHSITSWKVQASNNGNTWNDIVPTNDTVFDVGVLNKFTFDASARFSYWRFCIISSPTLVDVPHVQHTDTLTYISGDEVGISMLQWIPTLPDKDLKRCHVGYIPRLTSNTNYRGFAPQALSEKNEHYIAANPFKGDYVRGDGLDGEWATAGVQNNFWIKITCPTPVRTWKFGFRGRGSNAERIYHWRIDASNDNTNWVVIYTPPNPTILGNTYQEFLVDSIAKFKIFSLYVHTAEATNPGLSVMQLFVYDD